MQPPPPPTVARRGPMADDDDGPPPDEEHPEDEEEEVIEMADSERASRLLQDDDEDEGEDEGEGDDEDDDQESVQRLCRMMSNTLFLGFESHVKALEQARERRREALAFKSAVEEGGGAADEGAAKQTQDELDGMGIWMPGDNYQGDVNMRTLQKLLARVDARGFERSAQQLEFHQAFMKAAARVLYKGDWETDRPIIMEKYGWTRCNSEVLISTPRRFGKTYSIVRTHHRIGSRCAANTSPADVGDLLCVPRDDIRPRNRGLLACQACEPQASRAGAH